MQVIKKQGYNEQVDRFWTMVKGKITARQWEKMEEYLEVTPREWAYMTSTKVNMVRRMSAFHIAKIAQLINVEPQVLILEWGAGCDRITLDEANELVKSQGYQWGVQTHVA